MDDGGLFDLVKVKSTSSISLEVLLFLVTFIFPIFLSLISCRFIAGENKIHLWFFLSQKDLF